MTTPFEFAKMGENLVIPTIPTFNTAINYLVTHPRKAFSPLAFITTEKDLPDVSFYQLDIDYNVMFSKTDTLIIRTGQHKFPDPQFERNYSESKSRGMIRGLYDFYDDRVSPGEQADRILAQIGEDIPEMELYIDWERSYGGQFQGLRNVVALMQEIERRRPLITCGLYTGYFWFRANSNPITNASQYNYLKTKPLWLAWYTNNPANVLIPAPWTSLTLWQYGTPVEDYGQKTLEIDKNYFNGALRDFYERYGVVVPVPGEPMFFRVLSASSNLRSSAGLSGNDLGEGVDNNAVFNDIVETQTNTITADGVVWRRVLRWWRGSAEKALPISSTGEVWIAEKQGTSIYLTQVNFTPPAPPPPPSSDYLLHYDGTGVFLGKYVRSDE